MAYVCVSCDNAFNSSRNLSRHDKEVHQKIRFSCSCGKDFTRNLTLNNHLETCKVGNNFLLNSSNHMLSDELGVGTQSLSNKINSNISQNMSDFSNNLSNSPDANDGYITDDEADSSVPKLRVKRFRKSKISHDSSDEEVDEYIVRKPLRKRVRISRKSQDGSGTDSKRLNDKMVNYSGKSDIFSKNKNDSNESDSEDNSSEVSDEELDDGRSRICYCRDCQSKSSKKNIKNQYIHSGESENQSEVSDDNESDSVESEICYCRNCRNKPSNVKNQYVHSNESDDDKEIDIGKEFNVKLKNNPSESDDDMGIDIGKESNVKLKNNPYNQYYESQALGGRVFSTIIGNHTGTNNVGGALSSLYRSSFRIPVTMRNGISRENDTNYGNTSPVSSYLNY